MSNEIHGFAGLIAKSEALAEELEAAFSLPTYERQPRFESATVAASLALEHGAAVRALLSSSLDVSATVVLRAQYEATLRSVWLCYSATEEQVALLRNDLTIDAQQRAKALPQAAEMLASLERNAPEPAVVTLTNFRTQSWAALNSFAHAGLHSMSRHKTGMPPTVSAGALRASNGLNLVAAMQIAVATGSPTLVSQIGKTQGAFRDCFL